MAVEGDLSAHGMRFAVVVARWNAVITDRLLQGALDGLYRSGAVRRDVQVIRVPGAWEIPLAARKAAISGKVDAVITLGVLCAAKPPTTKPFTTRSRAASASHSRRRVFLTPSEC